MDKVVVVSKLRKVWFSYNSKLVGGKKFFCLGYVVIDNIVVDFNIICLYIFYDDELCWLFWNILYCVRVEFILYELVMVSLNFFIEYLELRII